jgi:hypothetical protein
VANVLHKTRSPADYRESVNTPDFPVLDWFLNPDISAVSSLARKYWRPGTNPVEPMDATEQATVDANEAAAVRATAKAAADAAVNGNDGYNLRAIAKMAIDEVNDLRRWIAAFKAQVALATNMANFQSRVAALPDMPDRTLAQAKTAYKNLIAGTQLDE